MLGGAKCELSIFTWTHDFFFIFVFITNFSISAFVLKSSILSQLLFCTIALLSMFTVSLASLALSSHAASRACIIASSGVTSVHSSESHPACGNNSWDIVSLVTVVVALLYTEKNVLQIKPQKN